MKNVHKIPVFWDVKPCWRAQSYWHFTGV